MMAKVLLREVTKRFGSVLAVDNVSLEIKDREFLVLVGPSGCGKSTTLRMVAGLEEITSGEIYIGDRLVNDVPPKDRDIAMVFQNYALYPHMDVYNNMAFGLKLRKFPKAEIEARVKHASVLLGIENLLDRKPKALSGGQRQRVAVGRAIVREPKVFLMDEPLSNLDAKLRVQMRAELNKLHKRLATTIIYVTHDQTEAMTLGDRIVVMKDGQIQQVGPPLELYNRPANAFVAGFIGSPAMNLIPANLGFLDADWIVQVGTQRLALNNKNLARYQNIGQYKNKEVILGIRPEDLEIFDPEIHESHHALDCIVEVREPMGSEIYLYLSLENKISLVARVPANCIVKPTEQIKLHFDLSRAHLFSGKTEAIIG